MIKAGSVCEIPVCQTDLFATIAAIVDFPLPEGAGEDSYSLLSVVKNEPCGAEVRGPVVHHSSMGYFAIRDGKWKLNFLRGSGGSLAPKLFQPRPGDSKFELYNMEEDPGETVNLYFEHPEIVEKLTGEVTGIIQNGRSTPGVPQDYVKENWPQIKNVME